MTLSARPVPSCVEQLERQLLAPPVVATTCLSIDQ
jgi:DNA replication ATP-dependent helicase Dna2